ncbi:Chondroitinase-AC, partial [termite gut metagenome]
MKHLGSTNNGWYENRRINTFFTVILYLYFFTNNIQADVISSLKLELDQQESIDVITSRLNTKSLSSYTNDTNPTAFFNSIGVDGSWSDVNYNDKHSADGWAPTTHLNRLKTMAIAFRSPASSWFENIEMQTKIEKGLLFYKAKNPQDDDNWWYGEIGDPQIYMVATLLLKGYSSYEKILEIATYLRDVTDNASHQGQNRAWVSEILT